MFIVSGATGQTGSAVAKNLLARGLPVRVLVRQEEKGEAWKALGAEVAIADLTDAESLTKALEGGKVLYVLNPPAYQSDDLFVEAEKVIRAFQTAIERSSLEKLVVLSSEGAQHAQGTGNILLLHKLEKAFENSKIPVTFVRPGSFMENWNLVLDTVKTQGVLPSFYQPLDRKISQVAVADIGRIIADAMTEKSDGVVIKELEGFRISPEETAEAFSKALGREIRAVAVPESQWLEIFKGFNSEKNAAVMVEMFQGVNSGHVDFETENPLPGEVTIDDFAREALQ
jgi:uncharacterized protein YbjT (DUF2867 family)